MRVRVDGSTNKFTTVRPRSAGTFLIVRSPTALKGRAVRGSADLVGVQRLDVEQVFAGPDHSL
ncbi:MAG: hypothetical protein Ct9H300mP32_2940 [Verrucomicrobiota bacterium]|nr:MAG: hypothetical protein Ct9H300mP32_2940 [Verrucomicrobiota bacterium]